MDAKVDAGVAAKERDLVITRVFDAPRELVWKAWTEREHLVHWSCPQGFAVTECDGDLRVGGAWRSCMHAPDGVDHRNSGVYREIVAPERLVYTFAWNDENGKSGHETLVTVTFAEENGKTRMTFRHGLFETTESRDAHNGGWSQCFDKLADYLGTIR
jgi:uncharacterized protein YndB with AHSA1/START domain